MPPPFGSSGGRQQGEEASEGGGWVRGPPRILLQGMTVVLGEFTRDIIQGEKERRILGRAEAFPLREPEL